MIGHGGAEGGWEATTLWAALLTHRGPDSETSRLTVRNVMPDVEALLRHAATAPSDFTLHDADHGFRVADRMASLIPSGVLAQLSAYEIALLLLSAYLHDIGMTPEQKRVRDHYEYLLTARLGTLVSRDAEEFQAWLDDNFSGVVPPLGSAPMTHETLAMARRIVSYYCRFRHNDWSESWMRGRLRLAAYDGLLDDLVLLCRSHHYGYEELRRERFNPRLVGSPAVVVHLRFLACVLRLADVLEFDPERTPDVVLRHRDIDAQSMIFWWKDHSISVLLEEPRIVISARPESALIHRAIEGMADDIERELTTCRRLADETHFDLCPGLERRLPHKWSLGGYVHRDIAPREGAYEYINGSFRPDTGKLLQLLSGQQLYGSAFAAVRELLQNAFDAVREQIAYERLRQPIPSDPTLESMLGRLNNVELRMEPRADGFWLVCRDTGVGMTKAIIKDFLLVSGAGKRHEILALERRCRAMGFELGRTGEFGIGVLSYFMIADQVSIRTRRSQDASDSDGVAWRFETEGVGSFGELRRDDRQEHGSEVALHLRAEIASGDATKWYQQLSSYIAALLIRAPCGVHLNSPIGGCESFMAEGGWVLNGRILASRLGGEFVRVHRRSAGAVPEELLPLATREVLQSQTREMIEAGEELQGAARWEVNEGALPAGVGRFRIHMPFFELPGGRSLGFLRVVVRDGVLMLKDIGKGNVFFPAGSLCLAWKGMRVDYSGDHRHDHRGRHTHKRSINLLGATVEVDVEADIAGTISVSRVGLQPTDVLQEALEWIERRVTEMGARIAEWDKQSAYASLNYRRLGIVTGERKSLRWLSMRRFRGSAESQGGMWQEVRLPAIDSLAFAFFPAAAIPKDLAWKGKPVSVIPCLGAFEDDDHYDGLAWHDDNVAPDRVVLLDDRLFGIRLVGLWLRAGQRQSGAIGDILVSRFPPAWSRLAGVSFQSYSQKLRSRMVWSKSHPLLRALNGEALSWCARELPDSTDPLLRRGDILAHRERAAAWILRCLELDRFELWDGLADRDPSFLPEIWRTVFGDKTSRTSPPIYRWVEASKRRLDVLTPRKWVAFYSDARIRSVLVDPGRNWILTGSPANLKAVAGDGER